MKWIVMPVLAASAAALGACAADRVAPPAVLDAASASAGADLRSLSGAMIARATATQVGDSIRIKVEAAGMQPGTYGAHVHTTGRCERPDFASAGPHWDPTGQQHGKNNPRGMHKGDLPNLFVGTDGRGSFEFTIPGSSVSSGALSLLDADGAAVVVHQNADDYRTDPSGNSGARIACGVLR
jgi:Cu-Zn family superoxide dismutase